MTTLGELLASIEQLDDDLTIYVAGGPDWTESSQAVAALEPDEGGLPSETRGMECLIEVAVAKEVLQVWQQWRGGQIPSTTEKCEAVIYYAQHDAYLPMEPKTNA